MNRCHSSTFVSITSLLQQQNASFGDIMSLNIWQYTIYMRITSVDTRLERFVEGLSIIFYMYQIIVTHTHPLFHFKPVEWFKRNVEKKFGQYFLQLLLRTLQICISTCNRICIFTDTLLFVYIMIERLKNCNCKLQRKSKRVLEQKEKFPIWPSHDSTSNVLIFIDMQVILHYPTIVI